MAVLLCRGEPTGGVIDMELVELVGGVCDGETVMVTAGVGELVLPQLVASSGPFRQVIYRRTGRKTADGYRVVYEHYGWRKTFA